MVNFSVALEEVVGRVPERLWWRSFDGRALISMVKALEFRAIFFQTAQLKGVFRVPEGIYYHWLPAIEISKQKDRQRSINSSGFSVIENV